MWGLTGASAAAKHNPMIMINIIIYIIIFSIMKIINFLLKNYVVDQFHYSVLTHTHIRTIEHPFN